MARAKGGATIYIPNRKAPHLSKMKIREEVYNTYWRTAAERQEIFFKKILNSLAPFTADPVYQNYKFCNVYRASDRVSQFLIKDVIYKQVYSSENTLFRILLFRLLNKIETWIELEKLLGAIQLKTFDVEKYSKALDTIKASNGAIYGNAFILCANKSFGFERKHQNHLALLRKVFKNGAFSAELIKSRSLKELFEKLRTLPLIGNFMAYQIAIDFNYSEVFDFDENDFTVAGPGAIRGINKCFVDLEGKSYEYTIQFMVESQDKEFKRQGLNFKSLWGRPMHAIDCQGWFCETDKYARVKFPELKSNRVRIKTLYNPVGKKIELFYPPKWKINESIQSTLSRIRA